MSSITSVTTQPEKYLIARNRTVEVVARVALLISFLVYFYRSIFSYLGAGRDDTFIALWTGSSLARGLGFVNYNLQPVEMSSSLLHTLMVSGIYRLAPDFVYSINKGLGLITGAIVIALLYQKRQVLFGSDLGGTAAFVVASLGLANNASWLYWNVGGLETPFQTLILFLYGVQLLEFWHTSNRVPQLVILQVLYILVRPEGFMLILFTTLLIAVRTVFLGPLPGKQTYRLLGVPALVFFVIAVMRYIRFGLLFPNPVYAKIDLGADSPILSNAREGLRYLAGFYTASPYAFGQVIILIALAIVTLLVLINRDTPFRTHFIDRSPILGLLSGLLLFNHFFILGTGGDWMEFFRFVVPIIPLLVILTTLFAFRMLNFYFGTESSYSSSVHIFANLALGTVFLAASLVSSFPRDNYEEKGFHDCSEKIDLDTISFLAADLRQLDVNLIFLNCAGKRDWEALMPFIEDKLPAIYDSLDQNLTVATFQMGFFPYYVKKIHPGLNIQFIDTLGLADTKIAQMDGLRKRYGLSEGTRIVDIFTGQSGELSEYILDQNPNMIYVLNATPTRRNALRRLGWTAGWDKPGAVIFIKND